MKRILLILLGSICSFWIAFTFSVFIYLRLISQGGSERYFQTMANGQVLDSGFPMIGGLAGLAVFWLALVLNAMSQGFSAK